jgi:hypothetical protein
MAAVALRIPGSSQFSMNHEHLDSRWSELGKGDISENTDHDLISDSLG